MGDSVIWRRCSGGGQPFGGIRLWALRLCGGLDLFGKLINGHLERMPI
jgi:hypothetical protein